MYNTVFAAWLESTVDLLKSLLKCLDLVMPDQSQSLSVLYQEIIKKI